MDDILRHTGRVIHEMQGAFFVLARIHSVKNNFFYAYLPHCEMRVQKVVFRSER